MVFFGGWTVVALAVGHGMMLIPTVRCLSPASCLHTPTRSLSTRCVPTSLRRATTHSRTGSPPPPSPLTYTRTLYPHSCFPNATAPQFVRSKHDGVSERVVASNYRWLQVRLSPVVPSTHCQPRNHQGTMQRCVCCVVLVEPCSDY